MAGRSSAARPTALPTSRRIRQSARPQASGLLQTLQERRSVVTGGRVWLQFEAIPEGKDDTNYPLYCAWITFVIESRTATLVTREYESRCTGYNCPPPTVHRDQSQSSWSAWTREPGPPGYLNNCWRRKGERWSEFLRGIELWFSQKADPDPRPPNAPPGFYPAPHVVFPPNWGGKEGHPHAPHQPHLPEHGERPSPGQPTGRPPATGAPR